jgi:hypothetical protein
LLCPPHAPYSPPPTPISSCFPSFSFIRPTASGARPTLAGTAEHLESIAAAAADLSRSTSSDRWVSWFLLVFVFVFVIRFEHMCYCSGTWGPCVSVRRLLVCVSQHFVVITTAYKIEQ